MGYTTDFEGSVAIEPPLNAAEISFLSQFNQTRRMARKLGPYYVGGTGSYGQGHDPDIINFNEPPRGHPSLWCQWTPTEDGAEIVWDEGEKFYGSAEWMTYIIDHFLKPGCLAQKELPFLQGNHTCNGVIYAQGEDPSDIWRLIVTDNQVDVQTGTVTVTYS